MKMSRAATVLVTFAALVSAASAKCAWHPIHLTAHIDGLRPGATATIHILIVPEKWNHADDVAVEKPEFETTYNFLPQGRHLMGEWPEKCSLKLQSVTLTLIVDGKPVHKAILRHKDFSFDQKQREYNQTTRVVLHAR
jgi:hypothetical protein